MKKHLPIKLTPTGTTMNGKPVFEYTAKTVLNMKSGFGHKLLCDGPTFSAGTACTYKCAYCFVEAMMTKQLSHGLKEHGLEHSEVVIRRANAIDVLRSQLLDKKGDPIYKHDVDDQRVVYTSPLVDCAGNMRLVEESAAMANVIFELTNWRVRFLSKSSLLPELAARIDSTHKKERQIYGVSTGTLDDKLASAFELDAAKVSKRLESLHCLQDNGYPTFGMICPSLPQEDYDQFARDMAAAIRIDKCEHVWGEVINLRGKSFTRTLAALKSAGLSHHATELARVCGVGAKPHWEDYARRTFLAEAAVIPPEKLRFLQYPTATTVGWWRSQVSRGAVLLGCHAEETPVL